MDVVLYIGAAAVLISLIFFINKVRGHTEQDDGQHEQEVVARAHPREAAPRGAGVPRRRRNLGNVIAQRRAQREQQEGNEGDESHDEGEVGAEFSGHPKIGAKKQRKLEEKQARRAQREAELEEREERKRADEKKEEERRIKEEKERVEEQRREEDERKAKEEVERKEYEEYLKLRDQFSVEEEGMVEAMTEEQSLNLLQEFVDYIKGNKVVLLEDLASHFGLRTQDAIARLQDLIVNGTLTGVIDDRGKFIYITQKEMCAIAEYIKKRGRVSIAELAQASNSLINLKVDTGVSLSV
ncbi:DDRGK domain-containing protein 1 isoform X2 [Polypterus senegalus]|uniref:DDRGK domain-containing protein 1 isoform X2 n=1 Tax=Polypterus senegalus TaxID=55291 RepID=UPI001965DCDF|nr:DDRGK domain-containing protein 1 isoform X2 [Polypterus senegalus]